MTNKELCDRYPFLMQKNVFEDGVPEDYDYEYTWLDDMRPEWREAFGLKFCEELREALLAVGQLDYYRVFQVGEKNGELRWYATYICPEVYDIEMKYQKMSREVAMRKGCHFCLDVDTETVAGKCYAPLVSANGVAQLQLFHFLDICWMLCGEGKGAAEIQYCPVCGRKLPGGDKHGQ